MALLAVGGESHGLVIGITGFAKCTQMAAHAFGGESETIELADGANLVAGVAVDGGMSSDERESILMLIDIVNGDLPAIWVVTEFTLRSILAAMQIRVAVLTLRWRAAENEILVAIGTLHF